MALSLHPVITGKGQLGVTFYDPPGTLWPFASRLHILAPSSAKQKEPLQPHAASQAPAGLAQPCLPRWPRCQLHTFPRSPRCRGRSPPGASAAAEEVCKLRSKTKATASCHLKNDSFPNTTVHLPRSLPMEITGTR